MHADEGDGTCDAFAEGTAHEAEPKPRPHVAALRCERAACDGRHKVGGKCWGPPRAEPCAGDCASGMFARGDPAMRPEKAYGQGVVTRYKLQSKRA